MPNDIQSIPETRKLDAEVSEQLFGTKAEIRHWFSGATRHYDYMNENHEIIPDYSTTWEGMRLVAEAMDKRGWDFSLQTSFTGYVAKFSSGFEKVTRADCKSAPHAAVLAAIEAIRGGEQQLQ